MKRRITVFTVVFSVSMLIGIQAVEVVDANPVPWPSTPNQDKPTITVETPQNNTVIAFNASDVWLNCTIANPDSWTIQYLVTIPLVRVQSLEAQLDGNSVYLGRHQDKCSVKLNLNQSAPGLHTLNVTVFLNSYYRGAAYNGSHIVSDVYSSSGPVYQYPWAASEIVYFTVEQPTPTQTSNASGSANLLNQTNLILIGTAIVIVAVASIVLVYFRKRKR